MALLSANMETVRCIAGKVEPLRGIDSERDLAIQDFMAGSLFDCYQASSIEFETPRTERNRKAHSYHSASYREARRR